MKNLKSALNYIFNWKEHPASVFILATPLFVLGFGLLWLQAILMYTQFNQIGYIILIAIATIALPILLYPAYKTHKQTIEWEKRWKEKYGEK